RRSCALEARRNAAQIIPCVSQLREVSTVALIRADDARTRASHTGGVRGSGEIAPRCQCSWAGSARVDHIRKGASLLLLAPLDGNPFDGYRNQQIRGSGHTLEWLGP